jgi:ribonuclease HI
MTSPGPAFVLWTDGSSQACDIGWGALLWAQVTQDVQTLAGGERLSVAPGHGSEVAEWYAAAEGLKLVRSKKRPVWLLSDCQSVVTFINDMVQGHAVSADAVLARVGPHAFFEVGHAVIAFTQLRALKVKGHAGSVGNELADALAREGREGRATRKGFLTSATLMAEVGLLRALESTAYSANLSGQGRKSRRAAPPAGTRPEPGARLDRTVARKLTAEMVKTITHGLTFFLTPKEEAQLAARAAELLRKAEALSGNKPAQRTKREQAIRHANGFVTSGRRLLLERKRREVAASLDAARPTLP